MFARRGDISADFIRAWMGNFNVIRNVAKFATRLGQSLASSIETSEVGMDEVEIIPDIESPEDDEIRYVFSDGIGKIVSQEFAVEVAQKCGCPPSTSAFQIRYAGFKGVVAVDPGSKKKKKLSLRNSMKKLESTHTRLDVLAGLQQYHGAFLNRQLITLLSSLSIEDRTTFLRRSNRQILDTIDATLTDRSRALEAVQLMPVGETTTMVHEMLQLNLPTTP
ncbi:unnamed protein product [Linum trigynum]|uniref:RNA-dependent RNA polymerase n=1 Tax=Linum trigynum TaxID=586398 RepID=A0AAV2EX55_9ROSI